MRRRILAVLAATALVVAGAAWSIFPNTEPPNPPLWTDHVDLLPDACNETEFKSNIPIELKIRVMQFDTRKWSFFDPAPVGKFTCGRLKHRDWETCGEAIYCLDGVTLGQHPVMMLANGQKGLIEHGFSEEKSVLEILPKWTDEHSLSYTVSLTMSERDRDVPKQNQKPVYRVTASATGQATIPFGETLVLGGLREKKVMSTTKGIPLLSLLPGVGQHFSYQSREPTEIEYVVFITPIRKTR
jgi:hypothetical protein